MYHPSSNDDREEFIELFNQSTNTIDLTGWRFTEGIRFSFAPGTALPGQSFLVVAADPATFHVKYPAVTNVVGGWDGLLSNSGQRIQLVDATGKQQESVRYADDGDWATRIRQEINYGHRGWEWLSEADGLGKSLELINPALPNKYGANWAASRLAGGTPGRANSVASANVAPIIVETAHHPVVPHSTDRVTVTARLIDESDTGLTATLHYRLDGAPAFSEVAMSDDGAHGDGAAGDRVYGAELPAQSAGAVVEFFIEARDAGNLSRTFPGPALNDGVSAQAANLLYQVDDEPRSGAQPFYRIILTAADEAELKQINRNSPAAPFATSDQTRSHAQMNATFISQDGTGTELRYNIGVRNRGNGSRTKAPQSFRVNFRNDQLWKSVSALNVNGQYPYVQLFGSALYRRAGVPTQESRAIQLRVNAKNLATTNAPTYGFYVCNEVLKSEFAARHFPLDSSGNIYRGIRIVAPGANLSYLGEDPAPYGVNYFKESNTQLNDWTDLIELTRVLDKAPDDQYVDAVHRVVNVPEWMRYFALETLVDNKETNLGNGNNGDGEGDDYFLYRGVVDRRFQVIPYDLDTILNQGDTSGRVADGLFRMAANSIVSRFVKHPEFVPAYYTELIRLTENAFDPAEVQRLAHQTLDGLVPAAVIESITQFASDRRSFVLSQIPTSLAVSNSLPVLNGYFHSTTPAVALAGLAGVLETRSVKVAGQAAAWTAWNGEWSLPNVPLTPGLNQILIQAFNAAGAEIDRAITEIWYDAGKNTPVSGTLSQNTVWSAAAGPYLVTGQLSVPDNVVLRIEPGASVFFSAGSGLTVTGRGQLVAEGTDLQRIQFSRAPGAVGNWGALTFNNSAVESRLAYVDIDSAGAGGRAILANNANIFLDHVTFTNTASQYITLENSSFIIRNSIFPSTSGVELIHGLGLPAAGHGLFEGNWFGTTTGLNDIIDFTGGQRPGAILQFLNNVFSGGSDDILDLDGTDAHIEGNVFMHVHQTASTVDSSSAISGGSDSGKTSRLVIVRNFFFDCDHLALAKEGNYYSLVNNTAVNLRQAGVLFDEPGRRTSDGVTPGQGAFLDGNIIWQSPFNFEDAYVNDPTFGTVDVKVNHSILAGPDFLTNGFGNFQLDPRLVQSASNAITAENIRASFQLGAGSPARNRGPNGVDIGAAVPVGVSISGEPPPTTYRTSATLFVDGPGYKNPAEISAPNVYKFRVNDGAWGGPIPIEQPIQLTNLANGVYTVFVIGQNDAGVWQSDPTPSKSWTVDTNYARVRINEILAKNDSVPAANGKYPDLVELYNDSNRPVDLSGFGLTDDSAVPFKFTFPAGSSIGPESYLVLLADNDGGTAGLHLGFALSQEGDALYLHEPAARGGALVDSVKFGLQLIDRSISRAPDGRWVLSQPTLGGPNLPIETGHAQLLQINEWLVDAVLQNPFVEVFNPDVLPVQLDGLTFTDDPVGWPNRSPIAPLSFIDANSYRSFIADAEPDKGPDHLDFKLRGEQGMIALLDSAASVIDWILYGPQSPDISQGRSPSGSDDFGFFPEPTAGGANPGMFSRTNILTTSVNLLTFTNAWKYNQTDGFNDTAWASPGFNDSLWPDGPALLYVERDALPVAKNTPLILGKMAYYFRSSFVWDTNNTGAHLLAKTVIDDGAVIYLNGIEALRLGMPQGDVNSQTRAARTVDNANTEGPFELATANLQAGTNVVAVEVHQVNATSSDIVFGLELNAVTAQTNIISDRAALQFSEVSARNPHGQDWVEFLNPSVTSADIGGLGLSNDPQAPRKFVFPNGTTVPAQGYLLIVFDGYNPASATNAGFNLRGEGDALYLFDRTEKGGALIDGVRFGNQVEGYTLGRLDGSGWTLGRPTPGQANRSATLGDSALVRINEWMAHPASGEDWFELFNLGALPVDLSGFYLTDDLNQPAQSLIAPYSFIGAGTNGYMLFVADGNITKAADHVNFKLSASGESIGLFSPTAERVDAIQFGPQTSGISEGRIPDGGTQIRVLATATPGSANPAAGDSDGDGLPDDWERAHGLDPFNPADALSDADGDGASNLNEFRAGTDPANPQSRFGFSSVSVSAGNIRLGFGALAGRRYVIQTRAALSSASWENWTEIPAQLDDHEVSVLMPIQSSSGFFRIVIEP